MTESHYACKFCIAMKGLAGKDIGKLPTTVDAVREHIERVHRYMVKRENETPLAARQRFMQTYGLEPKTIREIFHRHDPATLRSLEMAISKCPWIEATLL